MGKHLHDWHKNDSKNDEDDQVHPPESDAVSYTSASPRLLNNILASGSDGLVGVGHVGSL